MKPFENHENYNCKATTEDGSEYFLYANWLCNNELHHWNGWCCEAGVSRVYIDKNLVVWSAECKNDLLGNINDGWQLFEDYSTCHRDTCTGCTEDLMVAKWKP